MGLEEVEEFKLLFFPSEFCDSALRRQYLSYGVGNQAKPKGKVICLRRVHLATEGKSCQTMASSELYLDIRVPDLFGKRITLASKCSVLPHSPLPRRSGK